MSRAAAIRMVLGMLDTRFTEVAQDT